MVATAPGGQLHQVEVALYALLSKAECLALMNWVDLTI